MWFIGTLKDGHATKPKATVIDGVQRGKDIFHKWSKTELAKLKIYPYREVKPDARFYRQGALTLEKVGGEVVGTYEAIAKDVYDLKYEMLADVNIQVASLQGSLDWYWDRAAKGGKAVPAEISDYAAAIYTEQSAKEAAINALVTLDDVIAYQCTMMVETRLVKHTDADTGEETYGPETETFDREVSMVSFGWPTDPREEADPAFVSIVEA